VQVARASSSSSSPSSATSIASDQRSGGGVGGSVGSVAGSESVSGVSGSGDVGGVGGGGGGGGNHHHHHGVAMVFVGTMPVDAATPHLTPPKRDWNDFFDFSLASVCSLFCSLRQHVANLFFAWLCFLVCPYYRVCLKWYSALLHEYAAW
jgi:hypothetical protein